MNKEEIKQILVNHSHSINECSYEVCVPEDSFNDVADDILSSLPTHKEETKTGVENQIKNILEDNTIGVGAYETTDLDTCKEALTNLFKKLQAFKDYVHKRLDEAGIEKEPNGEHSKAGCRIGDRLDILIILSLPKPLKPLSDEEIEKIAEEHWKLTYLMACDNDIKGYVINDFISGYKKAINNFSLPVYNTVSEEGCENCLWLSNEITNDKFTIQENDKEITHLTSQLSLYKEESKLIVMNMKKLLSYDSTDNYSKGLIKSILQTIKQE